MTAEGQEPFAWTTGYGMRQLAQGSGPIEVMPTKFERFNVPLYAAPTVSQDLNLTLLRACRQAIVALKGREHDGFLRDAIHEAESRWLRKQCPGIAVAYEAGDATDSARLDWLARRLFCRHWDGNVSNEGMTHWSVASNHRHIVSSMRGRDLRAAIDEAMKREDACVSLGSSGY